MPTTTRNIPAVRLKSPAGPASRDGGGRGVPMRDGIARQVPSRELLARVAPARTQPDRAQPDRSHAGRRPSETTTNQVKTTASRSLSPVAAPDKPEPKILFQKFFKSVGPRTYAAQVKELLNGNQLLVLTEGKRDSKTGEVRKTRLFVYGEDFTSFFRLLHETATFMRANPVSEEIRHRREKFWARKAKQEK